MKYLGLIRAERVMEQMSEADATQHYADYAELDAADGPSQPRRHDG